ncbi:MFS general substrate transporter [Penicillium macrosclerotiorum]|uniref:MFS general substrate transporter n=1 Tax=Penicillium macrosclerotiorum TaxID=303699 RepID=UPI002548BF72|nr:MFS general substrate transporter [Penicillium macrosclerotiorum]KAJ5683637.1 MFS general substrate transporter [Penicillium macrosclerotiorum]
MDFALVATVGDLYKSMVLQAISFGVGLCYEFSRLLPNLESYEQHVIAVDIPESSSVTESIESSSPQYLQGTRLYTVTATLCLCLFLTNLEIPIVSTALVSIAGDLGGLDKIYWITTAYMLGYAGVLVLSAKASDIFGRKACLLTALIIFVIFSAACGAAQTMNQLVIFRALQGLGGAGNYAICSIIVVEMVPPDQFAKYTGGVATVFVFSLLFGPLFGGAITQHSTWRWVFLLNIPPGVIAVIALFLLLPNGFPFHHKPREARRTFWESFMNAYHRIDITGAFLLVAATVLLAAGLNEADERFAWRSAFTIAVLTISGILWVLFPLWERRVTLMNSRIEPVFPWRFFYNRVWMAMLVNAVFLGMVFFATMFIVPQRFEIVNGLSSFDAAVRFIPFTVFSPVGSMLSPTLGKAFKIPLMYLLIMGSAVQILAFALLGTLPNGYDIPTRQYGYQILAGFGCGINIPLLTLMTPFATEKRDHAVAMGAIAQFRILGGSIGLAIVTAVQHGYLRSHLRQSLEGAGDLVEAVLQSTSAIATLPSDTQDLLDWQGLSSLRR